MAPEREDVAVVRRHDDERVAVRERRRLLDGPRHLDRVGQSEDGESRGLSWHHSFDVHETCAVGVRRVSENAVINANYLRVRLKHAYRPAFDRACLHECVLSASAQARLDTLLAGPDQNQVGSAQASLSAISTAMATMMTPG